MLLSFAFYVNSLGNFLLQIVLGHLLSPAEYGWYATVSLAALSLAGATLDWLRVAALRYSDPTVSDERVGSVLELGYLSVVVVIYLAAAAAFLLHWTFGLTPTLLILTPLLAVGFNRVDFLGARLRARRLDREFSLLFGLRQALYFTLVVAAAWLRRDAAAVIAGMAFASFASAALVGRVLRAPLARFGHEARQNLMRFFAYGQPVVVSLMLYQLIYLVNRSFALNTLGASAAGELSLATDIGSRLFMAVNTLPEFLLFQLVLTEHRERGVSAATRQLEDNAALAFALMAGLAAGYMAMADTFASLVAPSAYRGDFSGLTRMLTPGFMAFCLITAAINPVFQLAQRTLPVALAGVAALAVELRGPEIHRYGRKSARPRETDLDQLPRRPRRRDRDRPRNLSGAAAPARLRHRCACRFGDVARPQGVRRLAVAYFGGGSGAGAWRRFLRVRAGRLRCRRDALAADRRVEGIAQARPRRRGGISIQYAPPPRMSAQGVSARM